MPIDSPSDPVETAMENNTSLPKNDKDENSHSTPESPSARSESQQETIAEEKGTSSGAPKEDPQQPAVSGLKRALIIVPATLVYFLVMLDSSIISTAIPQITDEFDSLLDVGWYGSAYQLASSAFVPLAGKIYTYFSTKVSQRALKPRPRRVLIGPALRRP
jgi:hypothetical protein